MKTKHLTPLLLVSVLGISACGSDGGGTPTVSQVVAREIAQNTGPDTSPIEINDLALSTADTREDVEPKPVP